MGKVLDQLSSVFYYLLHTILSNSMNEIYSLQKLENQIPKESAEPSNQNSKASNDKEKYYTPADKEDIPQPGLPIFKGCRNHSEEKITYGLRTFYFNFQGFVYLSL